MRGTLASDDVEPPRTQPLARDGGVLRSLVALDALPYPPIGGQQLRYRQAIEALAALGPVTLLLLGDEPETSGAPGLPPFVRLDPEPPRSLAYRWARFLGPSIKKAWRARLRQRFLGELRQRVHRLIDELDPDLVLVESAELATYLPLPALAERRLVYDAHNVETRLWGELFSLRERLGGTPGKTGYGQRIVAGEAALTAHAEQIWACSEEDARRFRLAYPRSTAKLAIVPNTVDTDAFAAIAAARDDARPGQPPTLLFTGNFGYEPNVDAARLLRQAIAPRLRDAGVPVRLVLCGRGPPAELRAASDSALVVTGEVADVRPWFAAADLFVVPLRVGGGTRLKILEALAAACPVVSTPKGAEGLEVRDREHLLLAETEEEIAAAVLWCLRHPHAALSMARRGRALVEDLYSWRANRLRVREALLLA